jgi:hypothetical protein
LGVSIVSPTDGTPVKGTVTVTLKTQSDVAFVYVFVDGVFMASAPPLTFSWNTTKVADGGHIIQADAYNASGELLNSAFAYVLVAN